MAIGVTVFVFAFIDFRNICVHSFSETYDQVLHMVLCIASVEEIVMVVGKYWSFTQLNACNRRHYLISSMQ